ncbi:uncharacterized protein LOC114735561 [Neltuma alba]|uniref:uncharacterized protein LOC114735561 n=1 Tax=Neltuma alba TaxID=207710 RepID=UPI0010A53BD3|nr:uncharacterized protein LOC114735561 [Prosopis alba]
MHDSLHRNWKTGKSYTVRDLDNGYFVASFDSEDDMNRIPQDGPWMVSNKYLLMQRWRPNFDPWDAELQKKIAVWVRIPLLPLEFFNPTSLRMIGELIERTLKIDKMTYESERGRFARICVEVDLSRRLKSAVNIFGKRRCIAYEGLYLICFCYGKFGHHKDHCPGIKTHPEVEKNDRTSSTGNVSQKTSGGIWITWNGTIISVSVEGKSYQFIHAWVTKGHEEFYITSVYASTNINKRRHFWRDLAKLQPSNDKPWVIGGDFNATLFHNKRRSSAINPTSIDREFLNWFEELELNDLGCQGPFFTWRREGCESRIDRVVANAKFTETYMDASVKHLPWFGSDHRPLLLSTAVKTLNGRKDRPFRFLASWVLHDEFPRMVVKETWDGSVSWEENIKNFTNEVGKWSHNVFGHIGRMKSRLMGRLEGINKHYGSSNHSSSIDQLDSYPRLDQPILDRTSTEVDVKEIHFAMFSMGGLKALEPDGLNALFFQHQWDNLGSSVIQVVKDTFSDPSSIQKLNYMFTVLIPKREYPETICDFRPIILCNVIYKTITKVIANRIKEFLLEVISPNQCNFVLSRTSADNIVVAQEVIHSMRNMQGKRGYMAIKIDLEKAYDRILWEGSRAEEFTPTRGLRQGDLLSPYLFMICMEKLAHLIQDEINLKQRKPIRLVRDQLSSWHASRFSLTGRDKLMKSVIAAMQVYVMQTANLSPSTCNEIERKARNFLWGSSDEKQKMHLVSWSKLCTDKKSGGLGMRHLKQQNKAFMMKLGWVSFTIMNIFGPELFEGNMAVEVT